MKRTAVMLALSLLSAPVLAKSFNDYFIKSDYIYLDYAPKCTGLSEDSFYDISTQCTDRMDLNNRNLSAAQAKIMLVQYSQCLEKNGLPKYIQQRCIAESKGEKQGSAEAINGLAAAFQQMAGQRGTSQITLPLPPESQLINHMYPEDIGGKIGAMKVSLAAAVFFSEMDIKQAADFYRSEVSDFLEFRHGNGDISFIKGAGAEVKKPKELLKAQMEKPNIQITKKVDMMTGKPASGSQITLFYER